MEPALFTGGGYIGQLWLLIVTALLGAMMAGALGRAMFEDASTVETVVIDEARTVETS